MSRIGQITSPVKVLHELRSTDVYQSIIIWEAERDGDFHFEIGPEERSWSGLVRSFKILFFLQKHTYFAQF